MWKTRIKQIIFAYKIVVQVIEGYKIAKAYFKKKFGKKEEKQDNKEG